MAGLSVQFFHTARVTFFFSSVGPVMLACGKERKALGRDCPKIRLVLAP